MTVTVKVPPALKPFFVAVEQQVNYSRLFLNVYIYIRLIPYSFYIQVNKYFAKSFMNLHKGSIFVHDERYMLVRASSLASDFHRVAKGCMTELAEATEEETKQFVDSLLFDLGHVIGM